MDGVGGKAQKPPSRHTEHGGRTRAVLLALVAAVLSAGLLAASASAHSAHKSRKGSHAALTTEPEEQACIVAAVPHSFPDIGESVEGLNRASSVVTLIEVECKAAYAEKMVRIAANELWARCAHHLSWQVAPGFPEPGLNEGKEVEVELEDEGNATVVAYGGPSCAPGGSLVTADLEAGTHPTSATEFVVEPPRVTKPGVFVYPQEGAILDSVTSSLAAIVVVEFPPGYAEELVSISDRQLFEKCEGEFFGEGFEPTKVLWWGPDEEFFGEGIEPFPEAVRLDDDGNAFVVVEGLHSCKAGNTVLEASLEEPPFTTYTTNLKILPPQPTFP